MTPGCYDVQNTGSWIEALEHIFRQHLPSVDLAMCFEHQDDVFKVERNGVTYYPIRISKSRSPQKNYSILKPHYLKVIEDFKPDIVHCFGTEHWHYGLVAKEIKIPVVIHMMGFMNIYNAMDETVIHTMDYWKYFKYNPLKVWISKRSWAGRREEDELEKQVMSANRYFMGRTEWDKNIVRYYSPESNYFYCPEAIRSEIYTSPHSWKFRKREKIRLVTIGNAGSLKGNEIMLKTAWLLKNEFKVDFEWIYTSAPSRMSFFENLNGIRCKDVGIRLIDRINAQQIAEELSEADLYIHPSIIDNSPNTVCEAQLIGTPVIAANTGGLPQMIEDGETGFLYPYSEPHALVFKIMNVVHDKALLEEISSKEKEMSHKRHDPESIANRILAIYQEVINYHRKETKQ